MTTLENDSLKVNITLTREFLDGWACQFRMLLLLISFVRKF